MNFSNHGSSKNGSFGNTKVPLLYAYISELLFKILLLTTTIIYNGMCDLTVVFEVI